MLPEEKISPNALDEMLLYSPETGAMVWKMRKLHWFSSEAQWKRWNTRYVGKPALTYVTPKGYKFGTVNGVYLLAHRVAWAIVNGSWPSGQIDHQNGDKADNRIVNLRVVCNAENAQNRPLRSDNKRVSMVFSLRAINGKL